MPVNVTLADMSNESSSVSQDRPVIVITGANGFLGRKLVSAAVSRGWNVRATIRETGSRPVFPEGVRTQTIDLGADESQWRAALAGVDVVVHAAARAHILKETAADPAQAFASLNTEATERIALAAAACGVKRFVFVSSIGVNGSSTESGAFTEQSAENPSSPYALSKRNAEIALRKVAADHSMQTVIVRPPLVYGPEVKANFLRLLALVDRDLPLPFEGSDNRRSFIFVDNLVDLILTCCVHPAAAGETFLAGDGSEFSTRGLILELSKRMGRRGRLFHLPAPVMKFAAQLLGRRSVYEQLCCSLEVNAAKAGRKLDWRPIVPPQSGLDSTVKWFVESNARRQRNLSPRHAGDGEAGGA